MRGGGVVDHVVGVHEDAAVADDARDLPVESRERLAVEPVQGGGREDGVVGVVRQLRRPVGVLQVGGDEGDAVVAGEGALGDGEEGRVEVDAGADGVGEAGEEAGGDGAGSAGEVQDARGGTDECLDHVEHDAEAFLAVGHVPLLLAVPALLPRLPVGSGRGDAGVGHRRPSVHACPVIPWMHDQLLPTARHDNRSPP
jgi:hypothetical protein